MISKEGSPGILAVMFKVTRDSSNWLESRENGKGSQK